MSNWKRWLSYGKAKLDSSLRSGEEELARREARLEAEAAEKPWLRSDGESPSLDDVRARIAYDAAHADGDPDGSQATERSAKPATQEERLLAGESIDFSEQQRQADERLAAIRSELGLDGTPADPAEPPDGPGGGPAAP